MPHQPRRSASWLSTPLASQDAASTATPYPLSRLRSHLLLRGSASAAAAAATAPPRSSPSSPHAELPLSIVAPRHARAHHSARRPLFPVSVEPHDIMFASYPTRLLSVVAISLSLERGATAGRGEEGTSIGDGECRPSESTDREERIAARPASPAAPCCGWWVCAYIRTDHVIGLPVHFFAFPTRRLRVSEEG